MFWIRWRDHLEIVALLLMLYWAGAAVFGRMSPAQRRLVDLETGLEQLYLMEKAHYQIYGRYFDPTSAASGLEWHWMDAYDWDYRGGANGFWLQVRADLNGDGRVGVWGIDTRCPRAHPLMDD